MKHGDMRRALAATDGAPLYAGLKRVILERILSGEWGPRHRVPSENELVEELGVSKMTANRALRELASEGALVRIRGIGSFVAEPKGSSTLFEVRNIAEEIIDRGHVHTARVVLLRQERADDASAGLLGVGVGTAVYRSLIVHSEDGVPVQVEDRLVNPRVAPHYLRQDFAALTPNAYLTRVAPLSGSQHVVEATMPSAQEGDLLAIAASEPCLAIRRRTWSAGRVVSFARLVYPSSRYRLEATHGTTDSGGAGLS